MRPKSWSLGEELSAVVGRHAWTRGKCHCRRGITALISASATQLTLSTLSNDFNPVKGAREMLTSEGLKSLGVNVATHVLAGPAPGMQATLPQIMAHAANRALIRGGLNRDWDWYYAEGGTL